MMSESVTSVSLPSRIVTHDEGKSKVSLRSGLELKLSLLLVRNFCFCCFFVSDGFVVRNWLKELKD
jgi:hypothetical protein